MALIDGMLQELEDEAVTTRRVLERVPDNRLGWRPHPKARTLGELALHVAIVPGGVAQDIAGGLATEPAVTEVHVLGLPRVVREGRLVFLVEDALRVAVAAVMRAAAPPPSIKDSRIGRA